MQNGARFVESYGSIQLKEQIRRSQLSEIWMYNMKHGKTIRSIVEVQSTAFVGCKLQMTWV